MGGERSAGAGDGGVPSFPLTSINKPGHGRQAGQLRYARNLTLTHHLQLAAIGPVL